MKSTCVCGTVVSIPPGVAALLPQQYLCPKCRKVLPPLVSSGPTDLPFATPAAPGKLSRGEIVWNVARGVIAAGLVLWLLLQGTPGLLFLAVLAGLAMTVLFVLCMLKYLNSK